MKINDCYFIGHISRKHGFKGDLLVKLDVDNPKRYSKLESVFLEKKGKLIPFFLSYCKLTEKGFLRIHFEGFDTESEVEKLYKCGLYLPTTFLPSMEGNKFYYHEIQGFKAIDSKYGEIGLVHQVVNQSVQPLLSILKGKKEVLIPIVDEIIKEVNRENKCIYLDCPEGLIDIYLNDVLPS